jgi:hypothetical protein
MPWFTTEPTRINRHTLRAQKLDRKYAKALKGSRPDRSASLRHKADRAARKGGWS